MRILCGVDLGGTKLSVGLFSLDGRLLAEKKVTDHSHLAPDAMVERTAVLIGELIAQKPDGAVVESVGVGMAGHIHSDNGLVITTSNFPQSFKMYPLRSRIERLIGIPVVMDNDAHAQAYGEYLFGAGRGRDKLAFLTISTGVGAGYVVGGRIFRGQSGFAGEIGHSIVQPDSPVQCTCGNYGCLMSLTGTIVLKERYRLCLERGMKSAIGISTANLDIIDGYRLQEGIESRDPISIYLFEQMADYLGIGIYNLYQTINPQVVILGGGLMNIGNGFFERIKDKFERLVQNMIYEKLEIVQTQLESRAGLLGAAALPLEKE